MKALFIHIALFLCIGSISAQSIQDYIDLGDNSFYNGEYYTASYYYELAIEIDSSNIEAIEMNAKAHFYYNNFSAASKWLSTLIELAEESQLDPDVYFLLGESYRSLGEYNEALQMFDKCLFSCNEDAMREKVEQRLLSTKYAIEHITDSCNATVSQLGSRINTSYSEFNPILLSDSALIFSSLRPLGEFNPNSIIETVSFSRIYISQLGGSGWGSPKEFSEEINSKDAHIANASFSRKYDKIFFTICNTNNLECAIYFSEKKDNKWSKPKILGENINQKNYTSTQPHFYEGEGNNILYFVSNRPGGYGGLDIWYSIYKEDKFYPAVNLGSNVNTTGNEITPFYNDRNSSLYFSSDWHIGFGGYDIFKIKGSLNEWAEVENLMPPINSSYNDFNYAIHSLDTNAHFSSNRPGSFYLKGETCCYDIFSVEYVEKTDIYVIENDTIIEDSIQQSIKDLLPLSLYFHNDEPNPRSTQTTTTINYKTTLEEYFKLKDKYKNEYSKGLTGLERLKAEKDIEDFFSFYIAKGFYDLELFTSFLLQDLERGHSVELSVKGYCSPLNSTSYNVNLAKRRIYSLIVFLREYNNGIFIPYMEGSAPNGAKLIIYQYPIGESLSNPFVSDNANDSRNSIYSRAAAFERKIQIIMYESAEKQSQLNIEKLQYDLGAQAKNKEIQIDIPIENGGNTSLQISSVEIQNPTTKYMLENKVIAPGEKSTLSITINTGDQIKYHQETITIYSNDTNIKTNISISYHVED